MLSEDQQQTAQKPKQSRTPPLTWRELMRRLGRQWFLILVSLGVVLCLLAPLEIYGLLKRWPPRNNVAVAMFLVTLGVSLRNLLGALLQPRPVLWALLVNYGLLPLVGWLVALLLEQVGYREYAIGLLICSSVPCTLASAAVWTRLAGGDEATAITITVLSTGSAWLLTSGWLALTLGYGAQVDVVAMMTDLLVVLVGPMLLAQLLRLSSWVRTWVMRRAFLLSVLARLSIMIIILHGLALMGVRLTELGWRQQIVPIALALLAAPGLHLLALGAAWYSGRLIGLQRRQRIAAAIAGSQKTLPVGLQLATTYFPHYPLAVIPVLFFHVGQLVLDTWIAERWKQAGN